MDPARPLPRLQSDGCDPRRADYAEADSHRALQERRTDGVACLCLSIGASTTPEALHRVFGSASHANAATLAELSPRMDELFLGALRELPVSQPRMTALATNSGHEMVVASHSHYG